MKPAVRISAVIINYKTPELTLAAVRSLFGELDPKQDRIFVVDNCSNDGSLEELQRSVASESWPGRIEILASDYNGGFSYGNNFAMNNVNAEAYLLLNSDAEVVPGAISLMWVTLHGDAKRGLVVPLVLGEMVRSK